MPDRDAAEPDIAQEDPERTFDRLVDEGEQRLGRSWPGLLATGLMGGLDIGAGVLALLLVEHLTGSPLLGGLAFSIGFIALTLARSELFTEDFLVPVAAVAAQRGSLVGLLRLWSSTLATNLASGWIISFLVVSAFPDLRETAVEAATHYFELGTNWRAFALAMVGGMLITLMTHLQHARTRTGCGWCPQSRWVSCSGPDRSTTRSWRRWSASPACRPAHRSPTSTGWMCSGSPWPATSSAGWGW
jgi:formate/nitrite transporter FocA (FNT family)